MSQCQDTYDMKKKAKILKTIGHIEEHHVMHYLGVWKNLKSLLTSTSIFSKTGHFFVKFPSKNHMTCGLQMRTTHVQSFPSFSNQLPQPKQVACLHLMINPNISFHSEKYSTWTKGCFLKSIYGNSSKELHCGNIVSILYLVHLSEKHTILQYW